MIKVAFCVRKQCKVIMGAEESKSQTQHNGDNQMKILNTQVQHTETLDSHTTLLWIVLPGIVIQITVTVWLEI